MKHRPLFTATILSAALVVTSGASGAVVTAAAPPSSPGSSPIATASIESHGTVPTRSDGDLWPSCWAANGNLYAANGDGKGFSLDGPFADIAVSEISGDEPTALSGTTIARGDQVGSIWSGAGYNRKPTGMVCDGDTLYLAVQDLALDFNDVPAATIVKSTDHGRTWTWDKGKPMFGDHVFTTIWFADFGRGGKGGPDDYVYAYGLDGNWRDSFDDSVADPQDVFLARVPRDKIQDRKAWQFYSGAGPRWSKNIGDRKPVLTDSRRLYQQVFSSNISNLSVISQGGVTYLPGLRKYIYSSWTEYTFEFYESPAPWGPWRHFLSKDFSGYPWSPQRHGGYATTIPSKFVAPDGRSMWVQANVCPCGGGGTNAAYNLNLRRFSITPADPAAATDLPDESVNLATAPGTVPISKSSASGSLATLNDGTTAVSENDSDDEVKTASWWGYTWPRKHKVNRVEFTSGDVTTQGGWFTGRPRVQIRSGGSWIDVGAQTVTPAYPGDASAGERKTYTLTFPPAETDGVRVIGLPGGPRAFSSVSELAVRYVSQLADGGFEAPAGGAPAWSFEGGAAHGVDRGLGFQHSGSNNGWIRTDQTGWSALTQAVPVTPGKTYTFSSWIRPSGSLPADAGRFGVRLGIDGSTVLGQQTFGAGAQYEYAQHKVTVTIPAGVDEVTVFAGFTAPGVDTWIQLDDFAVAES